MKTQILFIIILCLPFFTNAQSTGSVKGKVIDKSGGLAVPSAHVYIESGGSKTGVITNLDGEFHIKGIPSGVYDVHVTCMGFLEFVLEGVNVLPGRPAFLKDIKISDASIVLGGKDGAVVRDKYEKKIIDPVEPTMKSLIAEEFENMPGNHNINDIVTTISPEIKIPDNGGGIIVRGSRSGSTHYFVDGVKMADSQPSIPVFAINSISVYTGGIPAQYGDITGGVIIIETKSYFDFLSTENAKKKRKKEKEEM